MKMELPLDHAPRTLVYRLMRYEVGVLDDHVVLTLQYAASVDAESAVKTRTFSVALPAEGAMRAAMGLLEAARGLAFDEEPEEASAKH